MKLTEEMEKMIEILKENDDALKKNNSLYKSYFAPEIPDKIMKNLIKHFDSHLPVHGVIAFFDEGLLSKGKTGILFTYDGFYFRDLTKSIYISYSDIQEIDVRYGDYPCLTTKNGNYYREKMITSFEKDTIKKVLELLKQVDEEYGQSSFKSSGPVKKIDIPKDMIDKCNVIIHGASAACGGVGTGFAQIPASDNAVIVPIQIGMIIGLGSVFGLNITEAGAKSIMASAGASIAGRTVSQFLVGWIPGIGNAINTATAAGITEAIGWMAVKNFYDRWLEDKNKGRLEGMKDGYVEASGEYERKLRKQAEEFLNQKKDYTKERDEYEKLLLEYEAFIKELENKCATMEIIAEMKGVYSNLKNLQSV